MAEKMVTMDNACNFIAKIIELGGVYKIDKAGYIVDVDNVQLHLKNGETELPVMIWSSKAKMGPHILFNPYVETMNSTEERTWFYSFLSGLPGHIMKNMMIQIINSAVGGVKDDYAALEAISPFVKEIDDKTKAELSMIDSKNILRMVYHKPSKTAQLQSKLFEDDFKAGYGKKIRVKTWKLLTDMFCTLMSVPDEAGLNKFKYEATILGMKQADAMLHLIVSYFENCESYIHTLLKIEVPMGVLLDGTKNLNEFYGVMRVFTSGGGIVSTKTDGASAFLQAPNTNTISVTPNKGGSSSVFCKAAEKLEAEQKRAYQQYSNNMNAAISQSNGNPFSVMYAMNGNNTNPFSMQCGNNGVSISCNHTGNTKFNW